MVRADEFGIAFGHCRLQDGALVIERPAFDELGRVGTLWHALATGLEHRPSVFGAVGGGLLLLVVLLGVLLVDLYLANPALAPIVTGLGVLGLVAVSIPLEWSYRRSIRQRNALRRSLAAEFDLRRPAAIPIEDITGVTVRSADLDGPFHRGHLLLVHYTVDGTEATTSLGFPDFMDDELATATAIFDRYGLRQPSRDGEAKQGSP